MTTTFRTSCDHLFRKDPFSGTDVRLVFELSFGYEYIGAVNRDATRIHHPNTQTSVLIRSVPVPQTEFNKDAQSKTSEGEENREQPPIEH